MNVLCLSLSPCLQRILVFKSLATGAVNRARSVTETTGGKGLNLARMLPQLGVRAISVGFIGGATGRKVERELAAHGVQCRHVTTAPPTRICQTLMDEGNGTVTELVEEAPRVSGAEWAALQKKFRASLRGATMAAFSGNLPPWAPSDAYARMIRVARAAGVPSVVDSSGPALLAALAARPLVAKLNVHELEGTVGRTLKDSAAIGDAAQGLIAAGATWVCVTAGGDGLWGVSAEETWQVPARKVRVVNPIGCGDAVTSGIIAALGRGRSFPDALRYGARCAADKVRRLMTWEIRVPPP